MLIEFVEEIAGTYFRSILVQNGDVVPQHVHPYDHATLVASGSARLYVDGVAEKDYLAGHAVEIKANKQHKFEALEANTRLVCIHHAESAEKAKEVEPCRG